MEEVIPLHTLPPNLILQLAYPSQSLDYARTILKELEELGVEGIYLSREPRPASKLLGKGYRGIVVKVFLRGAPAAAKVLRTDSGQRDLEREARMTMLANSVGVGPKLLGHAVHVILLEYVEGTDMDEWLGRLKREHVRELMKVLRFCLEQARKLDEIGLDHGELSDARRHVLVKPGGPPVILDFGKASTMRKPRNVTSLFSYITHGPHSQKILGMLGIGEPPLDAARNYKRSPSSEAFQKLLTALNLYEDESEEKLF